MNIDEAVLIKKLKENDSSGFEQLVEIYSDKIFKTAIYILGNYDDAVDAVQDVFLSIHKNIRKFNSKSTLSTWIYRISVNTCYSILRKRKNLPYYTFEGFGVYNDSLDSMIVREAIFKLKNEYRTLIVLRDINGFSYSDISTILNIPEGTVKSRISRARSALRDLLDDSFMKGDRIK